MLFLGLGTGLGSATIVDGVVEPMELAHLPYKKGKTYEEYLGLRGLTRMGKKKWRRYVASIVEELQSALEADYVVLGGGNAKTIKTLPPKASLKKFSLVIETRHKETILLGPACLKAKAEGKNVLVFAKYLFAGA
jgi:hypothetical protein